MHPASPAANRPAPACYTPRFRMGHSRNICEVAQRKHPVTSASGWARHYHRMHAPGTTATSQDRLAAKKRKMTKCSFQTAALPSILRAKVHDVGLPFAALMSGKCSASDPSAELAPQHLALGLDGAESADKGSSRQRKWEHTTSAGRLLLCPGNLPASTRSRRRDQRLLTNCNNRNVSQKGFLEEEDLRAYARDTGLPEDYVPPFLAASANSQGHPHISFERFRSFVASQEVGLRRTFDNLDTNKDGELTSTETAAGLASMCFTCPQSRCAYKCTPRAVQRLLRMQGMSESSMQRSMTFKEFRRLFLLLSRSDMLVDYWLRASAPALCDIGGCVVVRDAAKAKGSPWGHLFAGAVAGATSRTATAPLETLRLQAMTGAVEGGPLLAAKQIMSRGWRALYRGNLLNVLRSAPQKALDFFTFDLYKALLGAQSSQSMLPVLVAGGLAGATSTAALHPLEVLRSRVTCDVTGQYRGALSAARHMVASEGVCSLYRGLGPSMLAILPEAAITYGMFDGLKRSYAKLSGEEEAGVLPSIAFGVASAFTGQMVAFPLESIARRLQVQQQPARSAGVFALIHQIVQEEGAGALYRGLGAALLRVFPMALVSFTTYEVVRLQLTKLEEARAQRRAEQVSWPLGDEFDIPSVHGISAMPASLTGDAT